MITENINVYQGQLQGPFKAGYELKQLINKQCISNMKYITHLGIETEPKSLIEIDFGSSREVFEIGKNGIYEIANCRIYNIKFLSEKDNNTIVDYIVQL